MLTFPPLPSHFPLQQPPPYFNVSVCQVVSRWDVGWILFCWGGWAAVFPVIEHKALSTAQEIIGPECNTAREAQKKIFSSLPPIFVCFISILLFLSFPNFFLLYLPFFPSLIFGTVVSFNSSATPQLLPSLVSRMIHWHVMSSCLWSHLAVWVVIGCNCHSDLPAHYHIYHPHSTTFTKVLLPTYFRVNLLDANLQPH